MSKFSGGLNLQDSQNFSNENSRKFFFFRKPVRPVSVAGNLAASQAQEVAISHSLSSLSNQTANEDMSTFHRELTETCVDMMARYTFSSCSTMPKRSRMAEFLLNGGQSQTWLLSNKLVTITTSGSRIGQAGLCEKCFAICKSASDKTESADKPENAEKGAGKTQ